MRSRAIGPVLGLVAVFFAGLLLKGAAPSVPTGTWQTGASLTDPRTGAVAVTLDDGRVLLVGGRSSSGPSATVELVGTNGAISAVAAMSAPRVGHTAIK